MLLAPKYSGIELPVYNEETKPWVSTQELYNQHYSDATSTDSKVVRLAQLKLKDVEFSPLADCSLIEILQKTDEELERFAKLCGASVVEHEWGLYNDGAFCENTRANNQPEPSKLRALVPEGYMLVAEVAVIRDIGVRADDYGDNEVFPSVMKSAIEEGVKEYNKDRQVYRLDDMLHLGQFAVGMPIGASTGNRQAWLVDIEPRWGYE